MSTVQLKNLSFSVGETQILKDIPATFPEGSLTCILGPNGAGKTSLIKAVCQLAHYSGDILINESDIKNLDSHSLARLVSYVPQSISAEINFSVEGFILLSRYPWQGISEVDKNKFSKILEITGLQDHLKQTLNTLSGGERQRALIAAALVQNTPVILLDEITSALDPCYSEQMVKLLLNIRESGKTLIWSTHDLNSALIHADNILALKNGSVFADGTAQSLIETNTFDKLYDRHFETLRHPATGKMILV
jgi:iron complex transport system ATP-binding protein